MGEKDESMDEMDFKKLFEEVKLDDISKDFDKTFTKIERISKLQRYAKYFGIGFVVLLISFMSYWYINDRPAKDQYITAKDETQTRETQRVSVQDTDLVRKEQIAPNLPQHHATNGAEKGLNTNETDTSITVAKTAIILKDDDEQTNYSLKETSKEVNRKKKGEEKPLSAVLYPCDEQEITAQIQTIPSCANKNDGQVFVVNIKGGSGPYTYKINSESSFSDTKIFKGLSMGIYSILIKDHNNCISKPVSFEIAEEICPNENDLIYSLSKDNEVKIPLHENDLVKILDNRGNLLLQTKMQNTQDFIFNASSLQGYTLKEGLYILFLTKASGKNLKYDITVLP